MYLIHYLHITVVKKIFLILQSNLLLTDMENNLEKIYLKIIMNQMQKKKFGMQMKINEILL